MAIALTLNDLRKRQTPDGSIDTVIETLVQSNPILEDVRWAEGNLPTGNQTTQRNGLPEVHLRQINRGVPVGKSSTKQVTDTCCLIESRSEVDVELVSLAPDKEAFRKSEDMAFVEAMGEAVAHHMFYGNSAKNVDEFNGLGIRYNKYGGKKHDASYQVINAGGTGKGKLSSAFLVGWGDRAVTGIYPKYGYAGLKRQDLGEVDAIDADGYKFRTLSTLFKWKPGLSVKDPEMVAAVRNIDLGVLNAATATVEQKKAVVDAMIRAQNRMRNLNTVHPVWYVSPEMYTFLTIFYSDKANSYITRRELMEGPVTISVNGILVRKEDALVDTEDAIAEAK